MVGNILRFKQFIDEKDNSYIRKKKRRLAFMLVAGPIVLLIVFMMSMCITDKIDSPAYVLSMILSAMEKSEENLTGDEIILGCTYFSRKLGAMGVGIGLAVAGIAYQAIIRNPLVDSYVLGVSSGAGTFAIASMIYTTRYVGRLVINHHMVAISAITGGLLAFFLTMILARRSGSTAVSYVLSGVIVGLAFSAIQSIMIFYKGDGVLGIVRWLFGSFTELERGAALCILIPVIVLTAIIMYFSKELNLVLLGERESQQMGLNVKRFNTIILVLASVLTSFCVAYVGIIGLVGLIVPHFCRMLFGGDHRITIPASIIFGGSLMLISDMVSMRIMPGLEFPVGAVTTLIGVPLFIYLLFKRGKIYNG